eukprot:8584024-Pyramimonas_sp.AAC.1
MFRRKSSRPSSTPTCGSSLKEVIMQKIKAGEAATQKGPSATPADHDEVPPDSHGARASDSAFKR